MMMAKWILFAAFIVKNRHKSKLRTCDIYEPFSIVFNSIPFMDYNSVDIRSSHCRIVARNVTILEIHIPVKAT